MIPATTTPSHHWFTPRATSGEIEIIPAANTGPGGRPPGMWVLASSASARSETPDQGAACGETHTIGASPLASSPASLDDGSSLDPAPQPHAIAATDDDGQPYPGDLLSDILTYRAARARQLQGESLDAETASSLEHLERCLRSRGSGAGLHRDARAYHRFECSFTAKVVVPGERPVAHAVEVRNLSAGGVMLTPAPVLHAGDAVWLELDDLVMMPARIAWARDQFCGLMFAGAPVRR